VIPYRPMSNKASWQWLLDNSGAALGAIGVVAYFIGWVEQRSYFETFRAGWLLQHVSHAELLSRAWPVVVLLTLATALLHAYWTERAANWGQHTGSVLYFAGVSLLPVTLIYPNPGLAFTSVWLMFVGLLCWVAVRIVGLMRGRVEPTTVALPLFILGLYMAPLQYGRARALKDQNQGPSDLPHVMVRADNGSLTHLRALLLTEDRAFAVALDDPSMSITTVSWERVEVVYSAHRAPSESQARQ
jgi:hypothetical protein